MKRTVSPIPQGWTWPEVLRFWRGPFAVVALLALAGCALGRFPGVDAARFPPPPIPMQSIEVSPGRVLTVPIPDLPPRVDQAAQLVYDSDGSGGWAAIDHDLEATPCLKHCGDPHHPGCWGICEAAGIDPRCPQQEAPTHLPAKTGAAPGLAFTRAPSGAELRCRWFGERDERQALACDPAGGTAGPPRPQRKASMGKIPPPTGGVTTPAPTLAEILLWLRSPQTFAAVEAGGLW